MKYIKRPIPVEAILFADNKSEIEEFVGDHGEIVGINGEMCLIIHTLEGDMKAIKGDYIIKGVKGEFYPCRKDIFEETYQLVEE